MAGSISSAGIGSGLKVDDIINSLMAVEKQPLTKLQTSATTMQTKLSVFGQMQSLVSSFRDAGANTESYQCALPSSHGRHLQIRLQSSAGYR